MVYRHTYIHTYMLVHYILNVVGHYNTLISYINTSLYCSTNVNSHDPRKYSLVIHIIYYTIYYTIGIKDTAAGILSINHLLLVALFYLFHLSYLPRFQLVYLVLGFALPHSPCSPTVMVHFSNAPSSKKLFVCMSFLNFFASKSQNNNTSQNRVNNR